MASSIEEPVNLGNPGEFTMIELAEQVRALTGTKAQLVHEPLPTDDPTRRRPDITRAQNLLGWNPTIHLDEGLRRTIKYFRGQLTES
jgi:UDP-glucuronate decarboxylase